MAILQKERGLAHIGTMGWSYPFWVGKFYPESTKASDYLKEYSRRFNSVEVDATFYRIPSASTVRNWADLVPELFRFTVKFPQSITHAPNLMFDKEKLMVFLERMLPLGEKLGPLILQLPPYTKINLVSLTELIDSLPDKNRYAIEFRNKSWFNSEVQQLLQDREICLVTTNKQGITHKQTSDFAYFRIEGNRKLVNGEKGIVENDRYEENMILAREIQRILDSGYDVFCYFSKFYSGYPPHDVEELVSALTL